ncbi:MAG TPA: hypothetical protein VGM54_08855 [Chthoniobacter sp.]
MKPFLPFVCLAIGAMLVAPVAHAQDTSAKGAGGNLSSLKQVTALLPHNLLVSLLNSAGKEAAASQATDILRQKAEGQTAAFKCKIDRVEKDPRKEQGKDGYRIKAEDSFVREGAANFKAYLWIHFNLTENDKVSAMKKGGEISVTGKITLASVTAQGVLELHVDLSDATVN